MSAGVVAVLFIAAALAGAGLLAVVRNRDVAGRLAGLPALAAAAALAGTGVSRFATGLRQPAVGHELAVFAGVAVLAATMAALGGLAWHGRVEAREAAPRRIAGPARRRR